MPCRVELYHYLAMPGSHRPAGAIGTPSQSPCDHPPHRRTFVFSNSNHAPSTAHHDRWKNRIAKSQISIGSNGTCTVATAESAAAPASDAVSARTSPLFCNRSITTSTATTACRTALWCSQWVVRCQPRVASATRLIVARQTGGAFSHGSAAGFARDVATTARMSLTVVIGSRRSQCVASFRLSHFHFRVHLLSFGGFRLQSCLEGLPSHLSANRTACRPVLLAPR